MGLDACVTPHSTYSLNRYAFEEAVGRCEENNPPPAFRPLSIHFLESEQEIDLFRRRGPLWNWYAEQGLAPDFLDYGGPAERLVAQVPPDRPVMLVHNCCVTQRDIDIVMGHFAAPVTWVVCPGSNRYISGLRPPVDLLRRNGLRIAVGTDSLASNTALSMVDEMRLLGDVPLAELLDWVAAGTIAPGHSPGLVHLTGVDLKTLTLPEQTKAQRII
jgi:cytosine/adenosine deaminase-related metal-dependent hydrolase